MGELHETYHLNFESKIDGFASCFFVGFPDANLKSQKVGNFFGCWKG